MGREFFYKLLLAQEPSDGFFLIEKGRSVITITFKGKKIIPVQVFQRQLMLSHW